jgi:hypothetical protein
MLYSLDTHDLLLELLEKSTYDIRKLETPKLLNFKIPVPPLREEQRILLLENNRNQPLLIST